MIESARRRREIERIRHLILRLHNPRLQMMLIAALTGAVGFLSSYTLLHLGIESMWLRYSLAVGLAYLVFLVLLRCWLHLRGDDLLDGLDLPSSAPGSSGGVVNQPFKPGGGQFGGGGSSASFDDKFDVATLSSEGGSEVSGNGSVLPDAASGLDLEELVLIIVIIVAIAFAISGVVMQSYAPEAKSVGEVLYHKAK